MKLAFCVTLWESIMSEVTSRPFLKNCLGSLKKWSEGTENSREHAPPRAQPPPVSLSSVLHKSPDPG